MINIIFFNFNCDYRSYLNRIQNLILKMYIYNMMTSIDIFVEEKYILQILAEGVFRDDVWMLLIDNRQVSRIRSRSLSHIYFNEKSLKPVQPISVKPQEVEKLCLQFSRSESPASSSIIESLFLILTLQQMLKIA